MICPGFFNTVIDNVHAVDGITMEFERGKAYGLVGESGCGKSTTGKSIIGLEKITSGSIVYEGENVTNKRRDRASAYSRDIQMIFQDAHSSLNPRKRVKDILAEPIRNFLKLTPLEEERKINELLAIVGMPEDAKLELQARPTHNFLAFINVETNKVNVIYKLKDGKNYGLVEPEA